MLTSAKFNLTFGILLVVSILIAFVGIQVDLFFNGLWLKDALGEWSWYNYFTSEHSLSVMYLQGHWWLAPPATLSFIVATAYAIGGD